MSKPIDPTISLLESCPFIMIIIAWNDALYKVIDALIVGIAKDWK